MKKDKIAFQYKTYKDLKNYENEVLISDNGAVPLRPFWLPYTYLHMTAPDKSFV